MTNEHQHNLWLAFIGPVFVFCGLLSSVSGLVLAVCRPPSFLSYPRSMVVTITDTEHEI